MNDDVDDPDSLADSGRDLDATDAGVTLRVATFNSSMFRATRGALLEELSTPGSEQPAWAAAVIRHVRPDVLLINEFDFDADGAAIRAYIANYLNAPGEPEAIDYEHWYVAPSNTGEHSGFDLDGNGTVTNAPGDRNHGGDAFGFGAFEGQYAFAVVSRYPIETDAIRSFRLTRWSDMPGNLIPERFCAFEARAVLRLSSKNHVDVPIRTPGGVVHLLASHPTPPGFDGDEDRNGRRNHDEIRFWTDYLGDDAWMTDDAGTPGGLPADAHFVIAGDLNSDPFEGDSRHEAIVGLLGHSRVIDPLPASRGGASAAVDQGRANQRHEGDPANDTADWNDNGPGNLRVDYVLPSTSLEVLDSGVFWPRGDEPGADVVGASDHRLVWVDVTVR